MILEHILSVIYRPLLSENGFQEVYIKDSMAEFIFVNEAYVRFSHTGSQDSDSPTFTVYFFKCEEAEESARECNIDISDGLLFKPDQRFFGVIDSCFRKHFISDDNVHEYVFRITANPLKNYDGTFHRVSIALHDIDLERFAHSPIDSDMCVAEVNGLWNDDELKFVRELKATIPSLPKPITRGQFLESYCHQFGRDKRLRGDALWLLRKEVGIL